MSGDVEAIATRSLRDYLLLKLPARCTAVNAARAAVLRAPLAGPYTISANKTLGLLVADTTFREVTLTAGTRTATQVAADINATAGLTGYAAVDSLQRWYVTSPTAPSASADSRVWLRGGTATDANTTFGFDAGGYKVGASALLPPYASNVFDGWPVTPVFTTSAAIGARIAIVIGERKGVPLAPIRRDEHTVTTDLTILRMDNTGDAARTREAIGAALQCVREVLLNLADGRTLGGSVQCVEEVDSFVSARPFSFTKDFHPLYDAAILRLRVRVFQRPEAS